MDTLFILPALTNIAGRCRILAAQGRIDAPHSSYKNYPQLWREVGLMNFEGKVVCLEAGPQTWQEIKDCEPLMAGAFFHVEDRNL